MLERIFRWLCKHNWFHDFQENEKGIERCSFCGLKKKYGSKSGYFSGPI